MSINLGQVAAIRYGTTPPSNKMVIWGETDINGDVLNFWRYDTPTAQWLLIEGEMNYTKNEW